MAEVPARLATALAALPSAPPLEQICRCAVEVLGVAACAVVLMSDDEHGSVAAAYGPDVTAVEDLQFTLGEGPCLAAFRSGAAVLEPDIASATERWPAFAPAALEAGAHAVFALPLELGAIRVGVLYVVGDRPGLLADQALADALTLAQLATVVVLDGRLDAADLLSSAVTSDGWAHRAVVHQATGMVAAQLDVGLANALAQLRLRAVTLDRSLYEVSADVIDRRLRFTSDGQKGEPAHES